MPVFHIVLVRPEIPQNTGSIARLAAATRTRLHLIGPLGFSLEDRYLKRAGLDYWPLVDLRTYPGWDDFAAAENPQSREQNLQGREQDLQGREQDPPGAEWDPRSLNSGRPQLKYFSARAARSYLEADYAPGDFLVFGSETKGLGKEFLRARMEVTYKIPIFEPGVRSLNLANAVSIVLYEALRQTGQLIV
jgi:tRNA (cytidine/uridine-2'-O-)-methyltransferase